ncbi:MAG: putative manganese-dependent inorganic diphosphatase [Victivallales bacterium]|nr:putative manganese-dependent inorganic diphosphatase [Victivallales bacterium]
MGRIFITGHKNPDMDSVASAIVYAYLKNTIDKDNDYIPICCGPINKQSKYVLSALGLKRPRIIKNVLPKVADIAKRDITTLDLKDPVYKAMKELDEKNLSVIPVFENLADYRGMVSIHEITDFLMNENRVERPSYRFLIDNFAQVLPGYFYRTGTREFSAPIMIGAMTYETSVERVRELHEGKPLMIVGMREKIIQFALDQQFPGIIITGTGENFKLDMDLSDYQGTIFISKADTAETARLLRLSAPVAEIMSTNHPALQSGDNFEDAKRCIVNSDYRGLPVFDKDRFAGIVTRRCFIEKPRRQLILVDHNEIEQSIEGADQARIVEIIDHHRLGAKSTNEPIYLFAKPVGCTCTIIYQLYKLYGAEIPENMAKLMLFAILSDTVLLKSPTTTKDDREAIAELADIAACDWFRWGQEMFSETAALSSESPQEVIESDFKVYEHGRYKIGVGQVETLTLEDFDEIKGSFLKALCEVREKHKLDWNMLLITNVIKEKSLLLTTAFPELAEKLIYEKLEDNLYFLPGVLSRKKQLLPELFRVIEDCDG